MDPTLSTARTIYFLGAGATRADFPDIPLMDDLLGEILTLRSIDPALLDFLRDVYGEDCVRHGEEGRPRPRIDDVLTLIDTALSGRAPFPAGRTREQLIETRRHLIASIGRVISRGIGDGQGGVAARFARSLPEWSSTILSTNYDIVMDNALLERRPRSVHYGVPIREAVHRVDGPVPGRFEEFHHFRPIPASQDVIRRGGIPLLKLNGSLNWLYCPRCDELDITWPHSREAVAILDEPELGRCSREDCTSPYETVLVGPSLEQRYEHRVLRDTWARAERALLAADRLVVIGYSLPDADYLIRTMLARAFARRSERVTVVTLRRAAFDQNVLERRYRRVFSKCSIDPGGFAGFVAAMEKAA